MSENKDDMTTMVSIVNKLTQEGFDTQFKATPGGLTSMKSEKIFRPADVEIKHFYRFEGESSSDDSSIVYAIETNTGEKGTLIDSYGAYSDPLVARFIQEVEAIKKWHLTWTPLFHGMLNK